ncbi:MAG: DUF3822 family protein [Urechidicola sp.]|nr:DUF3822 family protein [Urechidicola sp.]
MENTVNDNKHLSILLRSNGFSFCILDKDTNTFSIVETISFNDKNSTPQKQLELLDISFKKYELLSQKFGSINVTHSNNLSTLVPKPFFNKENLKDYLKYNLKVLSNDFVAHDSISNADIINVYIPFVHYNNYLFESFGSFNYHHSSTVLIEMILSHFKNSDKTHFFVNVEDDLFQIVILKNKKIEFFNTFNYKTKEDFIYYILFATEQLQLNPEELQLTFLGDIEKESQLFNITFKYVRNIDFYSKKNKFEMSSDFSNHSNCILLNQY